jgi:glutamate 5-kinase
MIVGMSKTIVVKVGSSTLTNGTRHLSKPNMLELVRQIATLHSAGHRVLLVSSGAMAAGRDHLGHPRLPTTLPIKQMLSAVGQGQLMQIYSEMFGMYNVKVGQVLVTGDDLRRSRTRYLNTRDTLQSLLNYPIVPIINENDTVTVEEIKVGDNDNLSALVASLINADLLILLTDQEGLYDQDPRNNPDAKLIPLVSRIEDVKAVANGHSSSGLGTGGMQTKLQAAEVAGRSGIETIITRGTIPNGILRVVDGESLGTRFLPTAPRVESRKRWLLSEPTHGKLIIDEGAARVLRKGESSLLPVGVRQIEGTFQRGALVLVLAPDGTPLAHGQVSYSSDELRQLCGVNSNKIEDILGYTYGDAAIHKDNMALLQLENGL